MNRSPQSLKILSERTCPCMGEITQRSDIGGVGRKRVREPEKGREGEGEGRERISV